MLRFDLDPHEPDELEAGEAPDAAADADARESRVSRLLAPVGRRWRALSRRARAVAVGATAGTVVVVLVGAAVGDAWADRRHAEAMRALPGGVADVSLLPQETWQVETDEGVLAVLPGGVVVTRDANAVLGLDVGTGDELWRHELGAYPDCGPTSYYASELTRPVDRVVCLSGDPEARTATVIDADGVVLGTREVGPANVDAAGEWDDDLPQVTPAADGAIAVVRGVSMTTTSLPTGGGALPRLERLREKGRWTDPSLRVEDALTGEVRGEAVARLRDEADLESCGTLEEDGKKPRLALWTMATASPTAAGLGVCGAGVVILPDGAVLDVDGPNGGMVPVRASDGALLLSGQATDALDDAGAVARTVPGYVLDPSAVDEAQGPWLVADEQLRVAAYDADGTRRWTSDVESYQALARVAGVAVMASTEGAVVGLDLDSGERLWTRDDLVGNDAGSGPNDSVTGVVTDGRRVLVGVGGGTDLRLVSLDARSGETLGEQELDGGPGLLLAVDGHVLVAEDGGISGVEEVDGVMVETGNAALRGLAVG
ncbi:hypothetical protein GCM10009809_21300 [Isoptericola hypogeus]|uniref:Pyrrolo-quinoline quinone repeat domain-containing protein n=2 Tax=Isoptericola hypogeus TaxID=300179 RepID=A0ABP4VFJ6_9MICO